MGLFCKKVEQYKHYIKLLKQHTHQYNWILYLLKELTQPFSTVAHVKSLLVAMMNGNHLYLSLLCKKSLVSLCLCLETHLRLQLESECN